MNPTQTNAVLRWLANLTCSLEDYQTFMEAGDFGLAQVSAGHAREHIDGIRMALDKIERGLPDVQQLKEAA